MRGAHPAWGGDAAGVPPCRQAEPCLVPALSSSLRSLLLCERGFYHFLSLFFQEAHITLCVPGRNRHFYREWSLVVDP